jgi:hypothetical protein
MFWSQKVDILGVDDKEYYRCIWNECCTEVSFDDIQNTVEIWGWRFQAEISYLKGPETIFGVEISNPEQLNNIVWNLMEEPFTWRYCRLVLKKRKTTYARESGQEVDMLNVIRKRSGQNMISAIDQVENY